MQWKVLTHFSQAAELERRDDLGQHFRSRLLLLAVDRRGAIDWNDLK